MPPDCFADFAAGFCLFFCGKKGPEKCSRKVLGLSVNSPALILSKNSGVFLAKVGSKSAKIGSKLAKIG